jgi:pimeloyl-ACP methyl ester carboxylesterase
MRVQLSFAAVCITFTVTLVLSALSGFGQDRPAQEPGQPTPMPGRLVDIGGWRLHLNCSGSSRPGQPTVVLEAGGGDFSVTWALVQPNVAMFARICSYDRSGSGWSDLGPNPRTMRQMVYELHTLLNRGGISPPFVLVGHSLGGFLARIYTSTYPSEVFGVVLVDASHEEDLVGYNGKMMRWWEEATGNTVPPVKTSGPMRESDFSDVVRERAERSLGQCGRVNGRPFDKLTPAAQQARTWECSQLKSHLPGESRFDGDEVAAIRAERQSNDHPLGDRPLVVVTRGISGYDREPLPEQREQERKAHQADLMTLSRNGKQAIAEGSGHQVHIEAPNMVVQAIRDVMAATTR